MWNYNLTVNSVFATATFPNAAQANLSGLGWRVIANQGTDGTTRVFCMLSDAATNGRQVHVFINAIGEIYSAQLA
jgi:hypothetical protein